MELPGGQVVGRPSMPLITCPEEPAPAFGYALVFAGVRMGKGIEGKERKEGEGEAVATPLPLP